MCWDDCGFGLLLSFTGTEYNSALSLWGHIRAIWDITYPSGRGTRNAIPRCPFGDKKIQAGLKLFIACFFLIIKCGDKKHDKNRLNNKSAYIEKCHFVVFAKKGEHKNKTYHQNRAKNNIQ